MLFDQPWVKKHYFVSDSSLFSFYGLIILSKWPCKFYE